MLVLSRQHNEAIYIGHAIKVVVVDLRGDKVRLGIEAPADCDVHREEVYKAILREGKETIADPLEVALSRVAELEAEVERLRSRKCVHDMAREFLESAGKVGDGELFDNPERESTQ